MPRRPIVWRVANDLFAVMALSLALATFLLVKYPLPARILIGFPFIFSAPGYALLSATSLDRRTSSAGEILAYSMILSLVMIAASGLIVASTPAGMREDSFILTLCSLTFLLSITAYLRRCRSIKLVTEGVDQKSGKTASNRRGRCNYALIIGILLPLPLALLAIANYSVYLGPLEGFTEFFLINSRGQLGVDSAEVQVGEEFTFKVYVANHENAPSRYRIETVALSGQWTSYEFSLNDGETYVQDVSFTFYHPIPTSEIFLALYENDAAEPCCILMLNIRVEQAIGQ